VRGRIRSIAARPAIAIGLAVARGALGGAEMLLPEKAAQWAGGRTPLDRRSTLAVRLLGGRQLGQALLTSLAPTAEVAAAGAVVDGIHAVSMLALAVHSTRWRRAAVTEALVATGLAGVGVSIRLPTPRAG
jgi:hypothetical protein